ncbi:MAG: hypothetical protein IT467_11635 [Dokdonella sp.]|nr:hypothetical protein [Dokdonella sp.]
MLKINALWQLPRSGKSECNRVIRRRRVRNGIRLRLRGRNGGQIEGEARNLIDTTPGRLGSERFEQAKTAWRAA